MLPVPLHVTPTFHSDLVALDWRLHFEFVTTTATAAEAEATPLPAPAEPTQHVTWEAPETLPIETMIWDLPVQLCATSPGHVAQSLQMGASLTVRI